MQKLNYCLNCQRVFTTENKCQYCNSENIKELKIGKPINIIGSKDKARYLRYKDGRVSVIIYADGNQKLVREYDIDSIRKIL